MKGWQWVGIVVVGLAILIGGGYFLYQSAHEKGRQEGLAAGEAAGRQAGLANSREVIVDTGTVSRALQRQGIHFAANHYVYDLGSTALADEAFTLLKGGALIELHDPSHGMRSGIHVPTRLFKLKSGMSDLLVEAISDANVETHNGDASVKLTHAANKAGATTTHVLFAADDDSEKAKLVQTIKAMIARVPVGSTKARVDLFLTTAQDPAQPDRWALVKLTLLDPGTSHKSKTEHKCSDYPDLIDDCTPTPDAE